MKMHANEADISADIVRGLIAEQFPAYVDLPIEAVDSSGTDNALYKIGTKLVARLPRTADKERYIGKEYTWLPQLSKHLPVVVPKPVALGKPSQNYPFQWAIYEWIVGHQVTRDVFEDERSIIELADFITALQKIDMKNAPAPVTDFDRGQPLARRDSYTREAIAKLINLYDVPALTGEWERALDLEPWNNSPVWIHGDLDGRNMLAQNGQLAAVIDFGSLNTGDPAYDVMVAWKVLSEKGRQTFRDCLDIDEATWTRSRGLALSQAVMILSYYTEETNPVLLKEARSWMNELGFSRVG